MSKVGIIYIAVSPSDKKYLGQTTNSLDNRISGHYSDSIKHTYAFANALRKYKMEDWVWTILYKNIPTEQLNNMEKWCIHNYNTYSLGYNSTLGGDHNPSKNPNVAEKISKSLKGRKQSAEVIEKRALKLRGQKRSEASKKKMSLIRKGAKYSKETKKKMSEAHKGVKLGKEHRNNISIAGKGRKLNEEHKIKIGKANSGKIHSKESRKRMSEAHKGLNIGERNPASKLVWKDVNEIRYYYRFNNRSVADLAKKYKVSKDNIRLIIKNITWKDELFDE